MSRIHEELENKDFPRPDTITSGTVYGGPGKRPIPGLCDGLVKSEFFAVGTVPTEYCDIHRVGTVCIESGQLATDACTSIEDRIITLMPENNSVSGSPLIVKSCELHPGNVIGGIMQPTEGGVPGEIGVPPEGEGGEETPQEPVPEG